MTETHSSLEDERRRFLDGPPSTGTWLRFCPHRLDAGALGRIIATLADPSVRATIEQADDQGRYPQQAIGALQNAGLSELFVPSETQPTAYHMAALSAVLAEASGSLAITVGVNGLALLPLYLAATPEQMGAIFARVKEGAFSALALTELQSGSDLLGTRATAEPGTLDTTGGFVPGSVGEVTHYRLSGEKQLINGGTKHDLIIVLLRSGQTEDDQPGTHSLFCIERSPEIVPQPRWRTIPAPAADISGLAMNGMVVSADRRIGAEGDGFALVRSTLTVSRGGVSALATGALTKARRLAQAYAENRQLYGRPIGALGGIAEHLLRMDALERAAAAASIRAMAWVNAAGLRAARATAVAKLVGPHFAEEAVVEGRRVLGGRALLRGLPYERVAEDVLLYGVFDGTSHLMLEELEVHLSLELRRQSTNGPEDTLEALRRAYERPPRSLMEALRDPRPATMPSVLETAEALGTLPGNLSLEALPAVARGLMQVVQGLKASGRWQADQGMRHDVVHAFALLEALHGLVELFDPDRRGQLMDSEPEWSDADVWGFRHAFGWVGQRAVDRLSTWVASGRLQDVSVDGFFSLKKRFLEQQMEARARLASC